MVDGRVADVVRDCHGIELLAGVHRRAGGTGRSVAEWEAALKAALEVS